MKTYKCKSPAQADQPPKHQLHIVSKSAFLLLLGFCLAGAAADVACYSRPGDRCKPDNNGSAPCDISDLYPPYGVCKRACSTTPGYSFSPCEAAFAEDKCSQAMLVMTVNQERRPCTAPMVCGPGTWQPWYQRTETNTFSWDPGYVICPGG